MRIPSGLLEASPLLLCRFTHVSKEGKLIPGDVNAVAVAVGDMRAGAEMALKTGKSSEATA